MERFPADIEQKLGFDLVRNRLAELAGTELGRERIEALAPLSDRSSVEERLAQVSEWRLSLESGENSGLGELPDLRETLGDLGPAGSWVTPEQAIEVATALRTARLVRSFFESRSDDYASLHRVAVQLESKPDLEKKIGSLFDESGGLRDDASPELRRIRRQIRTSEDKLRRAAASALSEARDDRVAAGEEPTIRGGRIVIPIKAEAKRKLDGLVVDSSSTGQTVFVEPQACVELNNELRILEGQERRETIRILERLTDRIRDVRTALLSNQETLSDFDVVRSVARLSSELDCVSPLISDDGSIRIRNGINPALELVRRRTRGDKTGVIPLSMSMGDDSRILIVSGPNAGGKSVAMKTVGLIALMLAYGFPVPADEETSVPLFDALFVDIGDEQSIETDLSTFSSHLERLRRIIERAGPNSLVLIDEIGTATDPTAGAAIGQAVAEHLVSAGSLGVITTHFGALKAFADETSGVVNGAMMFDSETLSPTYIFQEGVPGSSFAFQIAERASFPRDVLDRARDVAGSQESNLEDLIGDLAAAKQRIHERETELARKLEEAEQARRKSTAEKEELDAKRDELLGRAEARAEALLKEANRTIENTIREIREAQAEREQTLKARKHVESLSKTVSERAERRRRKRKPVAESRESTQPLTEGDRVVLDDGHTVGEVESIEEGLVSVMFGSMPTKVDPGRLTKVGGRKEQQVKVGKVDFGLTASGGMPEVRQRIDLRGHRVAEAIPKLERFIDQAIRVGLGRIEILHGTGTGALRAGLWQHLDSMPDVKRVSEAPIEQGGAGISVVDLV